MFYVNINFNGPVLIMEVKSCRLQRTYLWVGQRTEQNMAFDFTDFSFFQYITKIVLKNVYNVL